MKRVNANDFYVLASSVHQLTEIKGGPSGTVGTYYVALWNSRQLVDGLVSTPTVPLPISRQAILSLRDAIDGLLPTNSLQPEAFGEALKRVLTHMDVYRITDAAKKFETVFAAELQTVGTYFIDQKGAYSTADLIDRAEIALPVGVRAALPPAAINDIRQAGRALVFDLPTAVGFHILRATESVIRLYYNTIVRTEPKQRDWGFYIKELKTAGADQKIVNAIDQLRELHRNPLMHPEDVLTEDEALVLFGIALSAIVAVMSDCDKRKLALAVVPLAIAEKSDEAPAA